MFLSDCDPGLTRRSACGVRKFGSATPARNFLPRNCVRHVPRLSAMCSTRLLEATGGKHI